MRILRFIWRAFADLWQYLVLEWRKSDASYDLREKTMKEFADNINKKVGGRVTPRTAADGKAILKREYAANEKGKTYTVREYEVPSPGSEAYFGTYVVPLSEETQELAAGKWDISSTIITDEERKAKKEEEKKRTFEHPVHDVFSVIAKEGEDPEKLKEQIANEHSKEDPIIELSSEDLLQGRQAFLEKGKSKASHRSEDAELAWKDLADTLYEATRSGKSPKTLDDLIDSMLERRTKEQ